MGYIFSTDDETSEELTLFFTVNAGDIENIGMLADGGAVG